MINILDNLNIFKRKKRSKIFCYASYMQVFISRDNDIYTCPECMVKNFSGIYLGNLYESSFRKIWNSSFSKNFRKKHKDNDYSNCYLRTCRNKTNFHMHIVANLIKKEPLTNLNAYPKIVTFGEDIKGFSNCINSDKEVINYELKEKYFEVLKNAKEVVFSYNIDPFTNQNISGFIKEVAEKFPHLKFNIVSNGINFNKENCDRLGITDKLSQILIFVNSSNKETYEKYIHNGDYDMLKTNLSWLKEMKEIGQLKQIFLAFPIFNYNYREIPQFVDFTRNYNAYALFWPGYRTNFNANLNEDYMIRDNDYDEFIKILNSNNLETESSSLSNYCHLLMQ